MVRKFAVMNVRILSYAAAMLVSVIAQGQRNDFKFKPSVMGGYFAGARVSSNQEDYISGDAYSLMITRQWKPGMEMGLSFGIQRGAMEQFYPVSFQIRIAPNPEKSIGFLAGFGYSGAKGDYEQDNEQYQLQGGFYTEVGVRWHYDLSDALRLKPQITLSRQTSRDEFDDGVQPSIEIKQDRYALHIGIALELQQ